MKHMLILILAAALLAGCGSEPSTPSTVTPSPEPSAIIIPTIEGVTISAATVTPAPAGPAAQPGEPAAQPAAYNGPAWTALPLIDVRTGATFAFADFAGRTVFVHPMATWCTNCRASQTSVRDNVYPVMDPDRFVFVSLHIETNITADHLADYANDRGFPWVFAIVTPDMLAALVEHFGATITNPPSQPHFIIGPDGTTTRLLTGQPRPGDLIADLNAASGS